MKTKLCNICKLEKDLNLFSIANPINPKTGKIYTRFDCYCKSCRKEKSKLNYLKYGHSWKLTRQNYNKNHREMSRFSVRKHRLKNKERINKEVMKRYYSDISFRLRKIIPSAMRKSLRSNKNQKHWENVVNYTWQELKIHLESKFQEGMSWENQGKWHIDHIRPVSSFNITSINCQDFRDCWALSNLQPLWEFDNLSKGSKIL